MLQNRQMTSFFQQGNTDLDESTLTLLQVHLVQPAEDFLSRPKKSFRDQIITLGMELIKDEKSYPYKKSLYLKILGEALEKLHSGSLILDDIQDRSPSRRSLPSLHKLIGETNALNVSGWLTFQSFQMIVNSELIEDHKNKLLRQLLDASTRAYLGQSLDVSVKLEKLSQVESVKIGMDIARLKTGSLTSIALVGGALWRFPNHLDLTKVLDWGARLGVCLQLLDDTGSFQKALHDEKSREDLVNRKLTAALSAHFEKCKPSEFNKIKIMFADENCAYQALHQELSAQGLVANGVEKARSVLTDLVLETKAEPWVNPNKIHLIEDFYSDMEDSYV